MPENLKFNLRQESDSFPILCLFMRPACGLIDAIISRDCHVGKTNWQNWVSAGASATKPVIFELSVWVASVDGETFVSYSKDYVSFVSINRSVKLLITMASMTNNYAFRISVEHQTRVAPPNNLPVGRGTSSCLKKGLPLVKTSGSSKQDTTPSNYVKLY